MKTIKDLCVDHGYSTHEANYYTNDFPVYFDTWEEFYAEFGTEKTDIDYNCVFRWDIHEKEDNDEKKLGIYYMQVTIIHQRKGIYAPYIIRVVTDNNVPSIISYLKKHFEYLKNKWTPINQL